MALPRGPLQRLFKNIAYGSKLAASWESKGILKQYIRQFEQTCLTPQVLEFGFQHVTFFNDPLQRLLKLSSGTKENLSESWIVLQRHT